MEAKESVNRVECDRIANPPIDMHAAVYPSGPFRGSVGPRVWRNPCNGREDCH